MPRISDFILDCVVYLYPSRRAAEAGETRSGGGCGFLVAMPLSIPGYVLIYVVTNSHVIASGSRVVAINRKDGSRTFFELTADSWLHHQDGHDIAVCALGPSAELHRMEVIGPDIFLTREVMVRRQIGPGTDVFMVGRLINHEGKQRNTPVVRFGHLAMNPHEPVRQPKRGFDQESFLIETRSNPGFSGSPVFLYEEPDPSGIRQAWLLGIDWGHLRGEEEFPARDEFGREFRVFGSYNTGMSGVVPAWHLASLLTEDRRVVAAQAESDEVTRANVERRGP